jgi:hypothetical protein
MMDNSPFSKLSKEIRDMIYEYTLPDPLHVVDISRGQTPEVVMTQLCRQMREEAHEASLTPYKLFIAAPPDLLEENGCHVPLPTRLDLLLKRGAVNFQQLSFLFRSKPTTIELHVVLSTEATPAHEVRNSYTPPFQGRKDFKTYGEPWKCIKDSVQRFNKAVQPHKLTLAFSCTYLARLTGPFHPRELSCKVFPRSARALHDLHVKVATAGSYQAARSALSKAVAEQKEEMELHQGADHANCSVGIMHAYLLRELENTEAIVKIFLEYIFEGYSVGTGRRGKKGMVMW